MKFQWIAQSVVGSFVKSIVAFFKYSLYATSFVATTTFINWGFRLLPKTWSAARVCCNFLCIRGSRRINNRTWHIVRPRWFVKSCFFLCYVIQCYAVAIGHVAVIHGSWGNSSNQITKAQWFLSCFLSCVVIVSNQKAQSSQLVILPFKRDTASCEKVLEKHGIERDLCKQCA